MSTQLCASVRGFDVKGALGFFCDVYQELCCIKNSNELRWT